MTELRRLTCALLLVVMTAGHSYASFVNALPQRPDQQTLKWKGRQIKVALSNSLTQSSFNIKPDSDVMGAVMRSFKAWEDAAKIEFVTDISDKQSISPSEAGDGISLITVAQTPDNVLLFSREPDRESAKTRVFYSKGSITEADIVLNPFQQFSTDGSFGTFDLQATLTHEIGHMLGLRHSSVLGAIMSESIPKNGTFGFPDLSLRSLSRNDIAAVRDLYGLDGVEQACCGAITGRLVGANLRSSKASIRVWAEESETGRVMAQTEAASDGTFRLGGLPDSAYSVFWQMSDDEMSSGGELGVAAIQDGGTVTLGGKITSRSASPEIEFIGINGFLANTAVPVKAGREYLIFLAGKDLDAKALNIQFNSALIRIASGPFPRPEFGESASVVSFVISVNDNAPSGLYTITAANASGSRASLVGAVKVD